MKQLTLHEAMAVVLRRRGGGWMSRDDIAGEIAAERLYLRPSDGRPAPSDQLRLRARKYQHIFECSDTACTRIRLREHGAGWSVVVDETPNFTTKAETRRGLSPEIAAFERRAQAAERYRPEMVRLLLVAESPPRALDRYFYFEDVVTQDSLFRYIVRSVLGVEPSREGKALLLARLRDSGVFIIDLNTDPSDRRPLSDHVPELLERIQRLNPQAVILIKATVYDAAFTSLLRAGLRVIDERIPFPGSGQQRRFQEGMARALASASFPGC